MTALDLWVPVAPVPAARPRVSKWGTYYPATYERFRKDCAEWFAGQQGPGVVMTGPLSVSLECVCPRPAKPTNPYPKGDVDNLAKGPLDAITKTKKFWGDDKQIVGLSVTKRYAAKDEAPGYRINIKEIAE